MILCAAMVAAIVVAAAAYLVAEPRYLATAQVALERTAEQVIDVDSVTPTADPDSAAVDTEVQALRSPELIGRVVDRLRLARSEEHTSELQSLMRISYAVFCLKKKNTRHHLRLSSYRSTNTATN